MFFIFFPITAFFIWLHFAKALLAIDTTLYLCPFILIKAGILTFIIFFPALIALTVLALLLLFNILYIIPALLYFFPAFG